MFPLLHEISNPSDSIADKYCVWRFSEYQLWSRNNREHLKVGNFSLAEPLPRYTALQHLAFCLVFQINYGVKPKYFVINPVLAQQFLDEQGAIPATFENIPLAFQLSSPFIVSTI